METLEQLKKKIAESLKLLNQIPYKSNIPINEIYRKIPQAMKIKYGSCFLGRTNLYEDDQRPHTYTIYIHGDTEIHTFEFDFCIPVRDGRVMTMINEKDKTPSNNTHILNRIIILDGIHLIWI